MYKLKKHNSFSYFIVLPSTYLKHDNSKPILISTDTSIEEIKVSPKVISTDSVSKDDKMYVQDQLLVGKEVTTITDTYSESLGTQISKNNYIKIFDTKEKLNNYKKALTKQLLTRQINSKDNEEYSYSLDYEEINLPNEGITIKDANTSPKASIEALKLLPSGSHITSISEIEEPYYVANSLKEVCDNMESTDEIINNIKERNEITDVSITPIRNNSKDRIKRNDYIVDTKEEIDRYKQLEVSDDYHIINISSKEVYDNQQESAKKHFKTLDECNKYIDGITNIDTTLTDFNILPVYTKFKINELYETYEEASKRKEELEKEYKDNKIEILKERDLSKDEENYEIIDSEYNSLEEVNKAIDSSADNLNIYSVIEGNRVKLITIDNEKYPSEEEALNRVNGIKEQAVKDIPIHYALTKLDDYYYSLSLVYNANISFYQLEHTTITPGYNYRVIAVLPKIESYEVTTNINKKITKYKIEKEENILGYSYECNVKYKEKKYKKIFKVNSMKPKYLLKVQTKSITNLTKTYEKVRKEEKPILKYNMKINDVVEKKEVLQNSKVYKKVA